MFSGKIKALIVINRLEKLLTECFSTRVLGQVQQVEAGVGNR